MIVNPNDDQSLLRVLASPPRGIGAKAIETLKKKRMEEHCSIGLVVTTDGTITEIPREDYLEAERRAIEDMRKTGKPFLIIINSRNPHGEAAQKVKETIQKEYGISPVVADCQALKNWAAACAHRYHSAQ